MRQALAQTPEPKRVFRKDVPAAWNILTKPATSLAPIPTDKTVDVTQPAPDARQSLSSDRSRTGIGRDFSFPVEQKCEF